MQVVIALTLAKHGGFVNDTIGYGPAFAIRLLPGATWANLAASYPAYFTANNVTANGATSATKLVRHGLSARGEPRIIPGNRNDTGLTTSCETAAP